MADSTIRVTVQADDQASAALRGVGASVVSLNQGLELLRKGADAARRAFDFADAGAQLTRLRTTASEVARQMGSDMDKMLVILRQAARGTVSDMDLIASASRAMMLGVSSNAGQLANLLEVASLRGRAMGLSTQQAFDDIVRGIGRMSPLILDNLGIMVDAERTFTAYAESIGKAASELTAAEKRQALLNAVLAEGNTMLAEAGGLADDAASGYERMRSSWKNFMDTLKETAGGALAGPVNQLALGLDMVTTGRRDMGAGLAEVNNGLIRGAASVEEYNAAWNDFFGDWQVIIAAMASGVRLDELYAGDMSEVEFNLLRQRELMRGAYADLFLGTGGGGAGEESPDMRDYAVDMALIVDSANQYDVLLTRRRDLEAEIAATPSWDSASLYELSAALDEVDAGLASVASNMVISMESMAAAADGIIEEGELQRILQMRVMFGDISEEAMNMAMNTYYFNQAIDELQPDGPERIKRALEWLESRNGETLTYNMVLSAMAYFSNAPEGGYTQSQAQEFGNTQSNATGGPPNYGGWTMVGERGFELISPTGWVYSHSQAARMITSGQVRAPRGLEFGGNLPIPDQVVGPGGGMGDVTGTSPLVITDPYSGGSSMGLPAPGVTPSSGSTTTATVAAIATTVADVAVAAVSGAVEVVAQAAAAISQSGAQTVAAIGEQAAEAKRSSNQMIESMDGVREEVAALRTAIYTMGSDIVASTVA